ncbi:MAG: alkyl hydroperoxide reductase [Phycisphaerales bacterium]
MNTTPPVSTAVSRPEASPASSPAWMGWWLRAAGVYNLAWGAVMILAPVWSLQLLGVRPASTDVWPELWGCIGMIIGVYGVGYLLAAGDPLRHWPITLVGLLGKILGPIGFVDAAMRERLPWSMGWTILTNDLLWWIPFSLILLQARRVYLSGRSGLQSTPSSLSGVAP